MFKAGDKVTVKSEGPWHRSDTDVVSGMTGEIVCEAAPGFVRVSFPTFIYNSTGDTTSMRHVAIEDLILIGSTVPATVTPTTLPTDAKDRKNVPVITGVFDYFPAAIAEIARVSKAGNDQHNPGQPLHWSRGKSTDHSDCIGRHLTERGTFDVDGMRHSAKMAWRALALLQEELEAAGAPMARGASFDEEKK